jgi:flavin reductase (DIM6/NTAB) family NADH-FMN oxidoreductase RutF
MGCLKKFQEVDTMKSFGAKTLASPAPVWVVGTYDQDGRPNVMTAAWAGICCSSPPCVCVSLRKATYSYGGIVDRKAFTINIPSEDHVKETDYIGMASGKNTNKFENTGLTPVKSDLVDAPYVKEFPMVLECELLNSTEIGLHTQFVGEIMDVKVAESVLDENGLPDIEKVKPFIYASEIRKYYGLGGFIGKAFSIGKHLKTT